MPRPWTQSLRISWRPELRFFEERIAILRRLEDAKALTAFRVAEHEVGAVLFGSETQIAVRHDGLMLSLLRPDEPVEPGWMVARTIIEELRPPAFQLLELHLQFVEPLPISFEAAVAQGPSLLLSRKLGIRDWAILADIENVGDPGMSGQVEFGIVQSREVPDRLGRVFGRTEGPKLRPLEQWVDGMFEDVSLFTDCRLARTIRGDDGSTLDAAESEWDSARAEVSAAVQGMVEAIVAAPERD